MERVRAKLTGQRWPRYHDLMQIQLRITMMWPLGYVFLSVTLASLPLARPLVRGPIHDLCVDEHSLWTLTFEVQTISEWHGRRKMRLDFVCASKMQILHDSWLRGFVALTTLQHSHIPVTFCCAATSGMDQGQEAERKHAEVQRDLNKVKDDQRRRAHDSQDALGLVHESYKHFEPLLACKRRIA